jgi:hypothetical protein
MDFVLRDAFMTGYSERAFDLDRLLRYSFFSERGLTIHHKGLNALLRFIQTKSELFRAVYFHRTVRAIDRTLESLFLQSTPYLFPGNPLDHLAEYRQFTEWSLLVDVARWPASDDAAKRELGRRWQAILQRQVDWNAVYEKNLTFGPADTEQSSIFSQPELVERAVRAALPPQLIDMKMWIDLPRHLYRPDTRASATGQNFLYNAAGTIRPLTDDRLFSQLPIAHRMCRVYLPKDAPPEHAIAIGKTLDDLTGGRSEDDLTNM